VQVRRCGDVRTRRCGDMRIRRCEDLKMGYGDIKLSKYFIDPYN